MTFTIAGSLQAAENTVAGTTTTFALTVTAATAGEFILAQFCCNTSFVTNVTSTKCTWSQFAPLTGATSFTFSSPFNSNVWKGTPNSTGSDTITCTFNASMGGANCRFDAREAHASLGSPTLDTFGSVNIPGGTNTWANLTPSGSGRMYWGWCEDAASSVSGSTPGFVYEPDLNGNACGYCLNVSAAYAPVWGDSNQVAGLMVLVQEGVVAAAPPQPLVVPSLAAIQAASW